MIIALTGAGISRASGIETFMERPDVRDKLHRHYAMSHPQSYRMAIADLVAVCEKAEPNDAHTALSEYEIPIVTMNIDGLHERAGSQRVIALHGDLPSRDQVQYADTLFNKPVLYGDPAPNYQKGISRVAQLKNGDTLLVIGASRYTQIAVELREIAYSNGARVVEIQENAVTEVRRVLRSILG